MGAQSSTVVIRGLSTQRLQALGPARTIGREALAGALLGLVLPVVVVVPLAGWLSGWNWPVAVAGALSLVGITTLAASAGAGLALVSASWIATATDGVGLVIGLRVAVRLLAQAPGG